MIPRATGSPIAVITNLALAVYLPGRPELGLQWEETIKVFLYVLVPVAIGMVIRRFAPGFAKRADLMVRIASMLILAVVIIGAVASNWQLLADNFLGLAGITVAFCVVSLAVGYLVPRLFRVTRTESIASSFEIGIHTATLSIVIAQTVLNDIEMSLPAAVYGVLMFFVALAFGLLAFGRRRAGAPVTQGALHDAR